MADSDPLHSKDTWLVNKDQSEYRTGGPAWEALIVKRA